MQKWYIHVHVYIICYEIHFFELTFDFDASVSNNLIWKLEISTFPWSQWNFKNKISLTAFLFSI